MIYTVTLDATIEKRIRGKKIDELQFDAQHISYNIAGTGIKVANYLKKECDITAVLLCNHKMSSFFTEELKSRNISNIVVESNVDTNYLYHYIDEKEEVTSAKEKNIHIEDTQMLLFSSVLKEKMQSSSTTVLDYADTQLSQEGMKVLYDVLSEKSNLILCALHPKYYDVLAKRRSDIFLLEDCMFDEYMNHEKTVFSERIEIIQKELAPLSQILIYMYKPNDFLIFYGTHVYRVLSLLKLENPTIYLEAIFAALLQCLETDSDFETMCKECLKMSVCASVSDGLFLPSQELKEKVEETIHIYPL